MEMCVCFFFSEYVCHFPVHQDGSCNGLQHYAALGGDSAGAHSVNLDCADRPQDVYSAVVTLVFIFKLSPLSFFLT